MEVTMYDFKNQLIKSTVASCLLSLFHSVGKAAMSGGHSEVVWRGIHGKVLRPSANSHVSESSLT